MPRLPGLPTGELKRLQRGAPRQDRNRKEFKPTQTVIAQRRRWASDLGELRAAAGSHAEALVAETRWAAIIAWLTLEWDLAPLTNDPETSMHVARSCQEDDRARFNLPSRGRMPHKSPLPQMSDELRQYVREVAAELIADWERAERPCMTSDSISRQHKRLHGTLTHKRKERSIMSNRPNPFPYQPPEGGA